jgi:hypothetical protein
MPPRMNWRLAWTLMLLIAYVIVVVPLVVASRREAALVAQTAGAERALAHATSARSAERNALRSNLVLLRDRRAALHAHFSSAVMTNLPGQMAGSAQQGGVSDFRFERQGDEVTGTQGEYRVYRVSIQGRGSYDDLLRFLHSLQNDAQWTMLLDNVTMSASGKDWQMTAVLLVYTLGN